MHTLKQTFSFLNKYLKTKIHISRSVSLLYWAGLQEAGSHCEQPSRLKSHGHARLRDQRCPSIGGDGDFLR